MLSEIAVIVVRGVAIGSIFAMIAMSFNIVYGATGILNFAQGNMFVLGGFAAFFLANGAGVAWWLLMLPVAGLAAAFNAASAVGRIGAGFLSDRLGALNILFSSMALLGTSMFVIWPFASSLGVTVVFVIVGGMAVGGFFATIPTVVGHIFGSANTSITFGMLLTGWTFGYVMVS